MTGKSGVVRLVKSCRTACGNYDSLCFDCVENSAFNAESECTVDFVVLYRVIKNIDTVENRYILCLFNCVRKNRLYVFTVDFKVSVASCNILSVLVL